MKTIFIDYETFYSNEYSLRKMTPVEYVLDPRFECIGAAIKEGVDGESYWVDGDDLPHFFKDNKPEHTALVSHNALFDACITAWKYNYVPKLTVDTLGIARATLGHRLKSLSLANVALALGIGAKGDTIHKVIGMNAAAIKAAGLYDSYIQYALNDADLCAEIYRKLVLSKVFPVNELVVMDMVLRCAIQPQFLLDPNVLALHHHTIKTSKEQLLARVGVAKEELMSNDKFAVALRNLGVEPPMKTSLVTGKEAYAFARTDPEFIVLEEHDNPEVQTLVAARLGHKSTLEETRTERLTSISRLRWPGTLQGKLPIPLRYSGAHTHRLCLVGETTIAVLRDNSVVYTRLDNLRPTDLVWDGGVFVAHEGLAYAGLKQVIEYEDVIGTPDHRVWTVECGYCPLETAKARGYHIARGDLPDAARIDQTVQRTNPVQDQSQIHLFAVRQRDVLHVEGLASPLEGVVPLVPQERADGRNDTFKGNAGACQASEREGDSRTSRQLGSGTRGASGEENNKSASQSTLHEVASTGLEGRNGCGGSRAAKVHQSGGVELPLLWGAGNRDAVCLDSVHGRLAADKPWAETAGVLVGSDRLQWSLRAGEPALGEQADPSAEPLFLPTWDIVNCGPRNRFMANGRIVHNSGDWSLNMQNLPRGGALRRAVIAPPDHKVVAADASQIEARMAAWICGQVDLVQQFADGIDVYSAFGTKLYGYEVSKKTPKERHLAKAAILGCGYGLGWEKFQKTVKIQTKGEISLTDTEAMDVVNKYRTAYAAIPATWKLLNSAIGTLAGNGGSFSIGPCVFSAGEVSLPSGLKLKYHKLRHEDGGWVYEYGGKIKRLYGGALLENIVQALARIVVMDTATRLRPKLARLDIQLALQVHDELVYVVPDDLTHIVTKLLLDEMRIPPAWAPTLPLDAEADCGPSYGDAH